MKNKTIFLLAAVIIGANSSLFARERKVVTFITDWGVENPSPEFISVIKNNPQLRITLPWPSDRKPSDDLAALVAAKRVELALTLAPEPVLPLLYMTRMSSPLEIEFSWPQDIGDIIVTSRENLKNSTGASPGGLYLRSGIFSGVLVPQIRKLGLRWVSMNDPANQRRGMFQRDKLLLVMPSREIFTDPQDLVRWISRAPGPFIVLAFDRANPLTPEFAAAAAKLFSENGDVRMATPSQVYQELRGQVPNAEGNLEPELSAWMQSPIVWYQLDSARTAIEEYKNSGRAQLKTLERLRAEIYRLYDFELIGRLQKSPETEDERYFQAGINRIYGILNKKIDDTAFSAAASSATRTFTLESTTSTLRIVNSGSAARPELSVFSVLVDTANVVFQVQVSTAPKPPVIDIYIDLNNAEGAGLMRLLPGIEAFMETRNAWEFALRIDKDQAFLYRAGRFEPTRVPKVLSVKAGRVVVPRSLLRGNPLVWGYQVLVMEKTAGGAPYRVTDFVAENNDLRSRILRETPLQFPAYRTGGR